MLVIFIQCDVIIYSWVYTLNLYESTFIHPRKVLGLPRYDDTITVEVEFEAHFARAILLVIIKISLKSILSLLITSGVKFHPLLLF